jgi:hypothetical protein
MFTRLPFRSSEACLRLTGGSVFAEADAAVAVAAQLDVGHHHHLAGVGGVLAGVGQELQGKGGSFPAGQQFYARPDISGSS